MIDRTENLSEGAREALEDGGNTLWMHQASTWEIQIKHQTGKLQLAANPRTVIEEGVKRHGIHYNRISNPDIWHLEKLPNHHRDPFDRILVSHALLEGMKLVTPDPEIEKYPVAVLW